MSERIRPEGTCIRDAMIARRASEHGHRPPHLHTRSGSLGHLRYPGKDRALPESGIFNRRIALLGIASVAITTGALTAETTGFGERIRNFFGALWHPEELNSAK